MQFGDEVVDLVVVGAVTAPDTVSVEVVKAEALRARYQRLQQVCRFADIVACLELMYVCRHGCFRRVLGLEQCHLQPREAVIQVSAETIFFCGFSSLRAPGPQRTGIPCAVGKFSPF
jgi:hypothetical protein